jgi:hypothetical protein
MEKDYLFLILVLLRLSLSLFFLVFHLHFPRFFHFLDECFPAKHLPPLGKMRDKASTLGYKNL